MGDGKAINLLDRFGNVSLAHPSGVHGNDFIFDAGDISLAFRQDLRLKRPIAVSGNLDRHFTMSCFQSLLTVAVSSVFSFFGLFTVIRIAEVFIHFSLEHLFKSCTKDFLQSFIQVFGRLRIIL